MLVERECPKHGYGLAGDGCPVCNVELSLERRKIAAMEKANELEERRQRNNHE